MHTVRVWKVTEYDVTLDVPEGVNFDIHAEAQRLAARGHTTDVVGVPGVVDRGTFPVIRGITKIEAPEEVNMGPWHDCEEEDCDGLDHGQTHDGK